MIDSWIKRRAKMTATYWAAPVANEQGQMTFDPPIEVKCFWVGGGTTELDYRGREFTSIAQVYPTESVVISGMMRLGKLTDLTSAQRQNPHSVEDAYEIRFLWEKPSLSREGQFQRKALLSGKVV